MAKTKVVLVCEGFPSGNFCSVAGQFLMSYDPEAFDGRGDATFTKDIERAMKFDDTGQAFACWTAIPKSRPLREDGKPNRPLTTFTIGTKTIIE